MKDRSELSRLFFIGVFGERFIGDAVNFRKSRWLWQEL